MLISESEELAKWDLFSDIYTATYGLVLWNASHFHTYIPSYSPQIPSYSPHIPWKQKKKIYMEESSEFFWVHFLTVGHFLKISLGGANSRVGGRLANFRFTPGVKFLDVTFPKDMKLVKRGWIRSTPGHYPLRFVRKGTYGTCIRKFGFRSDQTPRLFGKVLLSWTDREHYVV